MSLAGVGTCRETSSRVSLALTLLLLLHNTRDVACSSKERNIYPLRRPLTNLNEAAHQTVGRDGPRYPDEGFLSHIKQSRGEYDADKEERVDIRGESCARRYVILTIANNIGTCVRGGGGLWGGRGMGAGGRCRSCVRRGLARTLQGSSCSRHQRAK